MDQDLSARFAEVDAYIAESRRRLQAVERQIASLAAMVTSLTETLSIVGDPQAVAGIARGFDEIDRGEHLSQAEIEELRRELRGGSGQAPEQYPGGSEAIGSHRPLP